VVTELVEVLSASHRSPTTEIFTIVDEFCLEFEKFAKHFLHGNPPKKKPMMSTSEVITIIIIFHLSCFITFKHFYVYYVQKHIQSEFPKTVFYNRFAVIELAVGEPAEPSKCGINARHFDDFGDVFQNLFIRRLYRNFIYGY
jgi:hypothetical protein